MNQAIQQYSAQIASILAAAGLPLELHFRCLDDGMVFSRKAMRVLQRHGLKIPDSMGNPSLKGCGFSRVPHGFRHPLSDRQTVEVGGKPEGTVNLWFAASAMISGANAWVKADRQACIALVVESVKRADSTADPMDLLQRARYCDRTLLQLASLVQQGLEIKCSEAFEE